MKKILLLATLSILASCNKIGENEYLITGKAEGFENGTPVILQFQGEMGPLPKDTVLIENGKFEFKGKVDSLDVSFIKMDSPNVIVPFILENGNINIAIQKDSLNLTKISGTENNENLQKFNNDLQNLFKDLNKFKKTNQSKWIQAESKKDTATLNSLMRQLLPLQQKMSEFPKTYMETHPNELISIIILENFVTRDLLSPEQVKTVLSKFDSNLLKTKAASRIKKMITPKRKADIETIAPNFSAPNPEGKTTSLKASLGKVTIIDFWASWCGPCRAENPNVVALYNEFHGKGLNIIGVSLDKDADQWKEAIAKDKLTWTHISNLKYWKEPIVEMYDVKSIPATFILDSNGKIVAKDLRGAELKAKIAELLSK